MHLSKIPDAPFVFGRREHLATSLQATTRFCQGSNSAHSPRSVGQRFVGRNLLSVGSCFFAVVSGHGHAQKANLSSR